MKEIISEYLNNPVANGFIITIIVLTACIIMHRNVVMKQSKQVPASEVH